MHGVRIALWFISKHIHSIQRNHLNISFPTQITIFNYSDIQHVQRHRATYILISDHPESKSIFLKNSSQPSINVFYNRLMFLSIFKKLFSLNEVRIVSGGSKAETMQKKNFILKTLKKPFKTSIKSCRKIITNIFLMAKI